MVLAAITWESPAAVNKAKVVVAASTPSADRHADHGPNLTDRANRNTTLGPGNNANPIDVAMNTIQIDSDGTLTLLPRTMRGHNRRPSRWSQPAVVPHRRCNWHRIDPETHVTNATAVPAVLCGVLARPLSSAPDSLRTTPSSIALPTG